MYNIAQILEKLKYGEITLELDGHEVHHAVDYNPVGPVENPLEALIKSLEEPAQLYQGLAKLDGDLSSKGESEELVEQAKRIYAVYHTIEVGGMIPNQILPNSKLMWFCHKCHSNLDVYLKNKNTLGLGEMYKIFGQQVKPCLFKDGVVPLTATINVPSGNMIFANTLREFEDAPGGTRDRFGDFDINYLAGQQNVMRHLASQGAGYGQMGNMSVWIYRSPDKDKLLVCTYDIDYYVDENLEGAYNKDCFIAKKADADKMRAEGYALMGTVDCPVWRWMCADEQALAAKKPVTEKNEMVEFDIKVGNWAISHHFSSSTDEDPILIASELELIKHSA